MPPSYRYVLSAPVPQVPGYLPQNRSAYLSLDLRFPEQDSTGNFVKQFLAYAAVIDADLIAVVNSQEAGFPEIFAGTDERQIIGNEAQIPTMIVNPIKSSKGGSILFS